MEHSKFFRMLTIITPVLFQCTSTKAKDTFCMCNEWSCNLSLSGHISVDFHLGMQNWDANKMTELPPFEYSGGRVNWWKFTTVLQKAKRICWLTAFKHRCFLGTRESHTLLSLQYVTISVILISLQDWKHLWMRQCKNTLPESTFPLLDKE